VDGGGDEAVDAHVLRDDGDDDVLGE